MPTIPIDEASIQWNDEANVHDEASYTSRYPLQSSFQALDFLGH